MPEFSRYRNHTAVVDDIGAVCDYRFGILAFFYVI